MKSKSSLALKILLGIAILVYCIIQGLKGGDFKIYLGAAELLIEEKNIYKEWIFLGGTNYGKYLYSPFFATLLIPFSYFPKGITEIIWLIANLFFIYRIYKISSAHLPLDDLSKKQLFWFLFLLSILSLRFVLHNFEMVQMNIFLLYVCLESFQSAKNGKAILSGLLLALGVVIKVLPLVMIPYFVFRKIFKPLPYFLVFFISFMILPAIFIGWDQNVALLGDWWSIIDPTKTVYVAEQNKFGEGVHSLSGLLAAYFSDTPSFWNIEAPRTLMVLSNETLSQMLNAFRLFFILLTFYFLRTLPFTEAKSKVHQYWELSYILAVVPLIFPHQQKYAFIFLLPAIIYSSFYLIKNYQVMRAWRKGLHISLIALFFLLAVLTTDGIIGKRLNDLSEHYKTITFGAFFLLILLGDSSRSRI